MKLIIEIDLDGAAFGDYAGIEATRILRGIEFDNDIIPESYNLRDINGNACGSVYIGED